VGTDPGRTAPLMIGFISRLAQRVDSAGQQGETQ
jgi:hypothetical protein